MTSKVVSIPSSGTSVASSIGRNTLFGVAGTIIHVLTRIVVVPVMIRHLGLDGYGIWAVLMSIAAYITLGGAGVKSAFQKYVAEATGNGDFDRASRLLSTGSAAVLSISVVVLVPLGILSTYLASATGVPSAFIHEASLSIRILAITAIFGNLSQTYQSIITGAHRIDLLQKIYFVLEPLSALTMMILLYLKFGLFGICAVFCIFQVAGGVLLYYYAQRVMPSIHVAPRFVSKSVLKELFRFGGSYQLVSMLEQLYAMVLPVATLRFFGANAAGVFALAARLVGFATMIQGSYLQALLSGGSMVYASGSTEMTQAFVRNSFKAMAALSVLPLAFIALYGTKIAFVWTGKADPLLHGAILLLCAGGICRSLSSLFRVLYRVSGGAVMDNAQLILGLVLAFLLWPFGPKIGFYGMVGGVNFVGQLIGLLFMSMSLTSRFKGFHALALATILLRFCVAAGIILGASALALYVNFSWEVTPRLHDTIQLIAAATISLLLTVPALLFTGSVTRSEARTMLSNVSQKLVSHA